VLLEKEISRLGQQVFHLAINTEDFDIPMFLSRYPARESTVFFVKGLKLAGRKESYHAYRALNIRRELLVDHRIRVVFWLTETEAADLPARAPDFWVYRHRVIEFLEAPAPENIAALTRWLVQEGGDRSMPRAGEVIKAMEKAGRLAPGNAMLWSSLADIYLKLNRTADALRVLRKAVRLAPENARSWLALGALYRGAHKPREARKAYQAACDLEPDNRQARAALESLDRRA